MKSVGLLVGINSYEDAPLRGCLPDLADMQQYLLMDAGWSSSQMKIVTEHEATKAGILAGIDWMAEQKPDFALFMFSGHGTRLRDRDGDEKRQGSGTKYDQAIVPYDYLRKGFMTDDMVHNALSQLPAHTKIVEHFDSCYSAKAERAFITRTREFYRRLTRKSARSLPSRFVTPALTQLTRIQQQDLKAPSGGEKPRPVLLLSGCRENETSADAYIRGAGYRGAFTYYFLRSARSLPGASYQEILEDARRFLKQGRYTQIPQITPNVLMPVGWSSAPYLK